MAKRKFWMRVAACAVIVLVGWMIFVSSKQIQRDRRIQEEVAALEAEAAKISRENKTLAGEIDYFSSSDFREQEAKQKLGLKKTEEIMAVIKPVPDYKAETEAQNNIVRDVSANSTKADIPNYRKWWEIFF